MISGMRTRVGRLLRDRTESVVLAYHRVADLPTDPQRLAVSPSHFAEQLQVIRELASVARLNDALDAVRPPESAPRVAITFDDGYRDNLLNAKPLLEQHDVPATVFIAAGYVRSRREPWWDELERIFLGPGTLPYRLELCLPGRKVRADLGRWRQYTADDAARHRRWTVEDKEFPTDRHRVYLDLHRRLRDVATTHREQALADLRTWSANGADRPSHQVVAARELTALTEGGIVEIGAHTMTHPVLSRLPAEETVAEIRDSRIQLEEMVGGPIRDFSYPYGGKRDYDRATVAAVHRTGFRAACSNFPGGVGPNTNRYEVPRFLVRDWDGDHFACELSSWLRCGA